ncbi:MULTISPECIES: outer membrane protein transport protein [unclassified Vibrio]|uniref:outer membrane protein transport protein n=1 Tax=unclassified Vibrio TaxID=2614977 RepID=UPI000C816A55|nr:MULTISPECIES: outer membrane protein transport protein [unclassified Vibrio]PMI23797.1 aromatic hydrocarbon degradation protein [Vibrio sp. 10N.286.46.E10]PMJ03203.1 aromatic hydrocarbon degradation protein [Vibrio sp. 10N.286.45.E10]PTP10998.1 aromatic hydrocarbon degradation protein [Vibrio sp. 10N.286.45.A3]PTQ24342.1 aromatic hydrocarbon degradation protein [Vibrio sp. 10N.286.46.E10]TKE81547.1 aromatic hydrocarbon degradation protein [Vibrio sp. F12]
MKINKTLLSAAVAVGLLSTSTVTQAAGFQLAEYSATGLGRAYAGEAAMADGADAQWRNPAMLTYLEGTQVSVGAIYVDPNIDIDGTSTSMMGKTTSSNSSDFAHSAVIPNFYVSHKYNEKFALGFAAGTNYGMETDLGKDFGGANHGNEASVTTMELNLNAAYQLLESVSLGGGIRYIMAEGSFGAVSTANSLVPLPAGTPLKYMEGDDTAWGWQIGTAWQINENNRLGFTYKSEVDLTLEGYAQGFGFNQANPAAHKNGSMDLALPATAELASFHQLTEKVAVHASVNWTNWSSFKELVADFPGENSVEIKQENWEDNYRFAIGTTYQMTPKLALRSGIAYDTSAVSEEHRTATIPETDRTWLSIGAGYQWSEQLTLDAGFTYILAKDAKMHETDAAADLFGGSFEGEVTGSIWLVGIQANYRF